eukprot:4070264-Pyramimonas_sp.AAC.2
MVWWQIGLCGPFLKGAGQKVRRDEALAVHGEECRIRLTVPPGAAIEVRVRCLRFSEGQGVAHL